MGKKFRETSAVDLKELIADLNRAYCDEWLAYYAYTYVSQVVSGKGYEDMEEFLEKIAKEELEHQEELSDMIQKLGGMPVANPSDLEKNGIFLIRNRRKTRLIMKKSSILSLRPKAMPLMFTESWSRRPPAKKMWCVTS